MYPIILDPPSPYQVNIPTIEQPTSLITTGENFIAYDETLPPAEQSYLLPDLRQLMQECVPTQNSFKSSEVQRTIASEAVKRLDEQAKTLIRKIRYKLNYDYMETPEAAEEWGFQVKQGTGKILLPKTRSDRLALLDMYIAKEESRLPEERLATPDLAAVTQVRDDLKANLDACRSNRSRRKVSYSARTETLKALYDTLRLAGGLIILKKFNRKLTPGLENWGIEVVKRQSKEKEADISTTNSAETIPPAETTTNGSLDLNGASEVGVELGDQG